MVEQTRPRIITDDDLLAAGPKARVEVIDGEMVVDMSPNQGIHGALGADLIIFLGVFVMAHGMGRVFSDMTAFKLSESDEGGIKGALVPDAAYVSYERLPQDASLDVILKVAPDIAVEVISGSESYQDVIRKTEHYLDHNVQQVWLILPERQEIRVFTPDNRAGMILAGDDDLTGYNVLPGFTIPVKAIFAGKDTELRLKTLQQLMGSTGNTL